MSSITLPEPEPDGTVSVDRAIARRASRRSFGAAPVSREDASRVLWAAQGVTHTRDGIEMRAVPSAGATYPLTLFLDVGPDGAKALPPGVFRYDPPSHSLERIRDASVRSALTSAAGGQAVVRDAPAVLVVTADFERTRREYPDHGTRYVYMEAGHVAENVQLVCEAHDLCTCPVGAFSDESVKRTLDLPAELDPVYLLPFGHRR
ncbi:dehydrogenase [Haladaptatus sp. W1]|uniref:SagB/ThcOx family dehydrogenase n=1 Tax=Haladaptatus sp. W1 TaxID=1897478 RepID=UPI000849744F|nr:SagB/ThcOx family dehydrogenase [Haladaptatus sp. W1]ODR79941.1 dehydrogenase [Haladaptatus sp. W1]